MMAAVDLSSSVLQSLFADPNSSVFAVLDGASVPDLLQVLFQSKPEHFCLYIGKIEPDVAETAPYLVRLQQGVDFTEWVVREGWGKHWGIFAAADVPLPSLRHHFRRFLRVKSEEGKALYFRYYDPRVLRVYLPTCNENELELLFGPVQRYFVEGENRATMIEYSRINRKLVPRTISLG